MTQGFPPIVVTDCLAHFNTLEQRKVQHLPLVTSQNTTSPQTRPVLPAK